MRRLRRSFSSPAMLVALVALVVALAGAATAAIPDGGGTITGCYSTAAGPQQPLSLLDTAQSSTCPQGQTKISWSQKGPAGPAGPGEARLRSWADYDPGAGDSTVRTLDLPAGKWLVHVTGDFAVYQNLPGPQGITAFCTLDTGPGGTGDEYVRVMFDEPGYADRIALTGSASLVKPGGVSFSCRGTERTDEIVDLRISAIRVNDLTADVGTTPKPRNLLAESALLAIKPLKLRTARGRTLTRLRSLVQGAGSARAAWRAEVVLRGLRGASVARIANETFATSSQVRAALRGWNRRGLSGVGR